MKRMNLFMLLSLLLASLVAFAGCSSSSSVAEEEKKVETPTPAEPEPVSFHAQFAGSDNCKYCHGDIHTEWKKSWHTLKATYGPAFEPGGEGAKAGQSNINPWTVANWGTLPRHMILDTVGANPSADKLAPVREANPGVTFNNSDLILTEDQFNLNDIAIVVGATRKQRYAVYYDGSPVERAIVAETADGGISYSIKKNEQGEPIVVTFPGNKARAGYNFLFIEVQLNRAEPRQNPANYSEFRSWQERCIGCHTTGFDPDAWKAAKADFMAGERDHLKDTFVTEIAISCEACHGPGADHAFNVDAQGKRGAILNPAKLAKSDPTRQWVCGQCHTRTQGNTAHGAGSNDRRGFIIGQTEDLMEVFEYTRPAWGKGNRQVSIDGKGRRDHQQDMDIMLSDYIWGRTTTHGQMACFDCHNAHGVGSNVALNKTLPAGQTHLLTKDERDAGRELIRLTKDRAQTCGRCHGNLSEDVFVPVMNGALGWDSFGFGNWANEGGRGSKTATTNNKRQHLFHMNDDGYSYGLDPEQYIWAKTGSSRAKTETGTEWESIWPWEIDRYEAKGHVVYIGADPENQN